MPVRVSFASFVLYVLVLGVGQETDDQREREWEKMEIWWNEKENLLPAFLKELFVASNKEVKKSGNVQD